MKLVSRAINFKKRVLGLKDMGEKIQSLSDSKEKEMYKTEEEFDLDMIYQINYLINTITLKGPMSNEISNMVIKILADNEPLI